jgi:ABC-type branched-subunit amino acid transport system substrate-binding protein
MNNPKRVALLAVLGIVALMAAACGRSGSTPPSSPTNTTRVRGPDLPAAPGFDPVANTIHVGVISPVSGPEAVVGKPLVAGLETWFDYVNSTGGIAGRYQVKLDEQDSQYKPDVAVSAYNKIKGGDVLIAQLQGTAETKAVLPLLRQDGIVAAPADLSADWVHDPNLLPVGAPYQVQMINAASYANIDLGLAGKPFCSLIQHDSYGLAGEAGVEFAANLLHYSVQTVATYEVGATDLTAQIQQLKSKSCAVVFLVSTPDITAAALGAASDAGFSPQWLGTSPSYSADLVATPLKDYLVAHYKVVSEGPQWGDRSTKGEADMLDRQAQFKPDQQPDYYFTFGYYQAWAVTQILEKAASLHDLSRSGIVNAMLNAGTLSFDGLSGDYRYGSPADRNPARENSIFQVDPVEPAGLKKVKGPFVSDEARAFANFTAG